jgi:hypothetical protein
MNDDNENDRGACPPEAEWGRALGACGDSGIPAPDPAFREALLARTAQSVRLRRPRRVALQAAAGLLLFLAGWGLGSRGETPLWGIVPRGIPPSGIAEPSIGVGAPIAPDAAPAVPADPLDLERALAGQEPAERRAGWEVAGNAYLGGASPDLPAALFCYQQVLAEQPEGEPLELEAGDSWLLKALKVARK